MIRTKSKKASLDLAAVGARLEKTKGRDYWRSLEEIAETPEFQELLHNEFAPGTSEWKDPVSRRRMLQLLGASMALAGLTACTKQPPEKIVPYVRAPEEIIPGKPLFFATAMALGGVARGVLVESHMGRPTKVEGNPQHPASLGASDPFMQASVLTLYDPDRSKAVLRKGRISTWFAFVAALNVARESLLTRKGAGFRILTETVTSPTLAAQLKELLAEFPQAKWHQHEPVGRDNVLAGSKLVFGEPVNTVYHLENADVILALDADFLATGPGSLRHARDFTSRRRAGTDVSRMNRLYMVEANPSITGGMADHRLPLSNAEIESFTRTVAAGVGVPVQDPGTMAPSRWVSAVVEDLKRHRGSSLVVAGDHQSAAVHALVHAINHALSNVGRTVTYTDPLEAEPRDQTESLSELVEEMKAGKVDTLLILGGNPVYNAPADLEFEKHLKQVKLRVHLGLYDDETAELCHWHIPETHYLETWSDARAYDGTVTILQPLISPLYDGKSAHEVLSAFSGKSSRDSHDIVKQHWRGALQAARFEEAWRTALHDGVVAGSALPPRTVSLQKDFLQGLPVPRRQDGLEISFRPDPTVWDGRFANNGWLQELPKPLTKLTWDNAALISPNTAQRLGVSSEQVIELRHRGSSVRAPVWILPGQADESVTVHLGYGRRRGGNLLQGPGFNAYQLRTRETLWSGVGLEIRKTDRSYPLACTQNHHSMEGRNVVRSAILSEFQKNPHFAQHEGQDESSKFSLYPGFKSEGYAWGMAIDLNACIGCSACVTACQAENNIAVVGKEEVTRGREMHWIRIDRYYKGGLDRPEIYHQPVPCMQCENAPCEVVCPVGATVHSEEGLNQMVYNRCVGTRYCSNNCPYKVRRFNFFLFSDWNAESLKPLRNPDVTVRSRGVMEKCTYCVQRINEVKIEAEKANRHIRDGEIVTACQQACPTQAISFGDINDPKSKVSRLKADARNYGLLTELDTRPRTTYLARVTNPNPELQEG